MTSSSKLPALPSPESLKLAQHIRLNQDRLRRLVRASGAAQELSRTQEAVLSLLDRQGSLTTADLAKRENLRPQSMGTVVADLLGLGFVVKSPHPTDRRRELVSLTPAGQAEVTRISLIRDQDLAVLFDARFARQDRALIRKALELLDALAEDARE
ncbi:hypothetical protein SD72_02795 [Leucobacter komagatae]|uniref:HTH marR-type domain-containing protein n=2 Tax=Leucobacter komagatae TaxID=55969 RepID=A0A0D0IRQ2_9MICO|nr:hypothetical protein SD72_02795 [Leucobacter komagatae]